MDKRKCADYRYRFEARRKYPKEEVEHLPPYKIGAHGKPFYQNYLGEWILSNKQLAEVRKIIEHQNS